MWSGSTESGDIGVPAAGNGSMKGIIYCQSDTESPIDWQRWGSINCERSNLEKRLQAHLEFLNRPLGDG